MNYPKITAGRLLFVVILAIVVWKLNFVFIVFLISFMLTVILRPFVKILKKVHLPAALAVFIPIFVFVSICAGLFLYVLPAARGQFAQLIDNLPFYLSQLPLANDLNLSAESVRSSLVDRFGDLSQVAVSIGAAFFHLLLGFLSILVVTVYWLSSYDSLKKTLLSYVPNDYFRRAKDVWARIESKLGKWFVGQIMVSVAVGVMVWIAALLLGLPYAGALGILAAILEIIPTVGPVLASVPAILIGLNQSVELAIITTIVYVVIQQVESHVLTPMLMGRAVQLHPIMIILAFLSGTVLFGILGALLAVPAALIVSSFVDSYRQKKIA